MFLKLAILFIAIPLLELVLLIKIGAIIGVLNTILLIFITGVFGAMLARQQGLGVIRRMQEELSHGRLPSDELMDGACILIGGALLLTPGLLTDAMGFALLISPVRKIIKRYLRYRFERWNL